MINIISVKKEISVIMPVYNQAHFIKRAIESLQLQNYQLWKLLIINDGSTDDLINVIDEYLEDDRIKYFENKTNIGLGASLNLGLKNASYDLIAYLPADDVFYKDHLLNLLEAFKYPDTILAYSGVRHNYNKIAEGKIAGYPIQLVQVLHGKTIDRWMEREELVTDDLYRMFWNKLEAWGKFAATGKITCEWVNHPHQRHKIIQDPEGGINPYKLFYGVKQPLRFHSTMGNFIDEITYFKPFRRRKKNAMSRDGLKIVLVGELAYNSERVVALEEQGHQLYGLWMRSPHWYNSIGPLPFGNIEDIEYKNWQQRIAEIEPDIIYAQLNWQAVP
ncbi:MAG: glycosyl transferase, partial [Mucilaginibacter sp.]|nr:glycosyl transferase [Mucilaginibacter sp.]